MNYKQKMIIRKAITAMISIIELKGEWTAEELQQRFAYFYSYIAENIKELDDLLNNKLPQIK